MADRAALLSHVPTQGLRGFEIGALMSPFLAKTRNDVLLLDRLSTEELRTKFATEPGVDVSAIADVDIVLGERQSIADALSAVMADGFDYAIASHVIEHVPDIVGWLVDIADTLKVGGRLLLVVPDKRYTFDYVRPLSTVAAAVDSWIRKLRTPSPGQVFDFNALAVNLDKTAAWSGAVDGASLPRFSNPLAALALSKSAYSTGDYVDSHCWVFTPTSFLGMYADLSDLEILPWRLTSFLDTRPGEEDFGLVLEKCLADRDAGQAANSFRAAARELDRSEQPQTELSLLRSEVAALKASRSWRFTEPARTIGAAARRRFRF